MEKLKIQQNANESKWWKKNSKCRFVLFLWTAIIARWFFLLLLLLHSTENDQRHDLHRFFIGKSNSFAMPLINLSPVVYIFTFRWWQPTTASGWKRRPKEDKIPSERKTHSNCSRRDRQSARDYIVWESVNVSTISVTCVRFRLSCGEAYFSFPVQQLNNNILMDRLEMTIMPAAATIATA